MKARVCLKYFVNDCRLGNCSHSPDKVIYNFLNYKLIESKISDLCEDFKFATPA